MNLKPLIATLLLLVLSLSSNSLQAATRTTIAAGAWNSTTTWDCGCIPASTDDAVINHVVTLTSSANISNVSFGSAVPVILSVGQTLNITGNLTGAPGSAASIVGLGNITFSGTGTRLLSGNIDITNVGGKTFVRNMEITTGSILFSGSDFNINGSYTITNNTSDGVTFGPGTTLIGTSPISSIFAQGVGSVLYITNPNVFIGSNVSFDAETNLNTVEFTGVTLPTIQMIPGGKYQILTLSEANSQKELAGDIIVLQELEWTNVNTVLDVSSSNFSIDLHNLWNDQSAASDPFVQRNGTVSFVGNGAQSIFSASVDTFYNVTINQSSVNNVTFWNTFYVENNLTMTNGHLNSRTDGLYIGIMEDGDILEGSTNSYIKAHGDNRSDGNFVRKYYNSTQDVFFPLGNTYFQAFELTLNSATLGGGSNYIEIRSSTSPTGHPNKPSGSYSRFWWLLDISGFVDIDYDATAYYLNQFIGTETDLSLGRWDGASWTYYGAADDALDEMSTGSGVTVLPSGHDFAGVENGALAIDLIDFKGSALNDGVLLEWATAMEEGNALFTIERSENGESFLPIGFVEGAGNSYEENQYTLTDADPVIGNAWYRLIETDENGNASISKVIEVYFQGPTFEAPELTVLGNTISQGDPIKIKVNADSDLSIRLINMNGQVLSNTSWSAATDTDQIELDVFSSTLSSGIYNIVASNGQSQTVSKLVVRN